jgi:hypothetical protein
MSRHSCALSLSLAIFALSGSGSVAQSLSGTGFSWYPSGQGDGCRILGGDDGEPFIFSFKSGQKYTFAQSCPDQLTVNGAVKAYQVQLADVSPGLVTVSDEREYSGAFSRSGPGFIRCGASGEVSEALDIQLRQVA